MGSFNTSCFVSQQTISTDDESIILPIVQQSTYKPVELLVPTHEGVKEVSKYGYCHSTCYATAFWGYAGPMIKGKYDDYGRFELEKTKENAQNIQSFFNSIAVKICDVKQGENEYHEHPLAFSEIYNPKEKHTFEKLVEVWDKVWDLAGQSRLFVKNYKGEPVCVAFAVMHKSSADYLVETFSSGKTWDDESLEPKSYFNTYINKRISEILDIFKDKKELDDTISFAAITIASLEGFRIGEQEGSHIASHYPRPRDVSKNIVDYFKNNPNEKTLTKEFTDELFENFKAQIEHRYLASGLERLSIKLSPMVYASQDYSNEIGNDYLKMIQAVNERVNKIVKDKYGEDDDFESDSKKPKI